MDLVRRKESLWSDLGKLSVEKSRFLAFKFFDII